MLLADLDQAEGAGVSESRGRERCGRQCYMYCCDVGTISILLTVALTLVGVVLLVIVLVLELPFAVDQLARYIISAGVFGLATGGTNAIALFMLLYKIPLVCGSGSVVIISNCCTLCMFVLQCILPTAQSYKERDQINRTTTVVQLRTFTRLHLQEDQTILLTCTGHREYQHSIELSRNG